MSVFKNPLKSKNYKMSNDKLHKTDEKPVLANNIPGKIEFSAASLKQRGSAMK